MSIDLILLCIAAFAAVLAAICAFVILLRGWSKERPLAYEAASQLLRSETAILKKAGDDQARGLRQELTNSLGSSRDGILNAFKTLNDLINPQIRDFGDRLDKGIKRVDDRVEGIGNKLDADLKQMGVEAHGNRESLRLLIESKLDDTVLKQFRAAKDFREEISASFQHVSDFVTATLTQTNDQQKERLDNFAQAVANLADKNDKAHEALRQVIEGQLNDIRNESAKKLDEMRQMVDDKLQNTLETRLSESFTRVVEQLSQMHQGIGEMKTLAASVGDLKHILTNPKIRGTFGEVQLSLLLEQFLTPDQYLTNATVQAGSSERIEFAIKMPGRQGNEVLLPVDAKFPIEDYQKLLAASDAGDSDLVAQFRKQLLNRVRSSARDIRDKYIRPPTTTNFGVMFLPVESLYAEILREPGTLEVLQRDFRVTLASPTTFCAYLNALQMGFQTVAIEKRSSEVWQLLGAVRAEFVKYNNAVQTLANQLNRAVSSVDKLGTRTRVMTRTLKTVDSIPDEVTAQKLLGLTPDELSLEEVEFQNPVEDATTSEIIVDSEVTS